MTAQLPDSLINRHPRVRFNGLALYDVIRGDIHREKSAGWGDGCAYRAHAVVPEGVVRCSNLWRGYVATFVLERDGRLRLRSFRFRIARTSQTQRVNEFIEGDFWMVLKRNFFARRTYVPFRDGIIVEDRSQWFDEKWLDPDRKQRNLDALARQSAWKMGAARVREMAGEIMNDPCLREAERSRPLQSVRRWLELYSKKENVDGSHFGRFAAAISKQLTENPELKTSTIGQKLLELHAEIESLFARKV